MGSTSSLRGLGQLAAYLPYQFGFTPCDSLVLVGFDDDDRVVVSARFDPLEARQTESLAEMFRVGRLAALASAALVIYDRSPALERSAELLRGVLEGSGIPVHHILSADLVSGTWSAQHCRCGACPRSSDALPDISTTPAALSAVVRGSDATRRRVDFENLCVPTDFERHLSEQVGHLLHSMRTDQSGQSGLDPKAPARVFTGSVRDLESAECLASALLAFQDPQIRAVYLHRLVPEACPEGLRAGLSDGSWDGEPAVRATGTTSTTSGRPAITGRLIRWACRVPQRDSALIWAAVAYAEWGRGGSALATIAIDRALAADPECELAVLVQHCLVLGLMPWTAAAPNTPPAA